MGCPFCGHRYTNRRIGRGRFWVFDCPKWMRSEAGFYEHQACLWCALRLEHR